MERALALTDAEHDVQVVGGRLPELWEQLREARAVIGLTFAGEADPDAGVGGNMRAAGLSTCDGIEHALSEAEQHLQVVRDYLAGQAARDTAAPPEIEASWKRFVGASDARSELSQLRAAL